MENYYSILGISPNATPNEIKRAYIRLAQRYHPDRFLNEEEKQRAHDQFSKITAAYRTLSDAKLKADYDQSLAKGVKPREEAKETQAKNAFTRALAFLKQNDPWRAVNLLRIAVRYHPQPIYLSYLGLSLVYTRQYRREGFEKLKEAIKQLMFNPMLYVNLGLAHEFEGNKVEALQAYYEALDWDNKNELAKRGIERLKGKQKKKGFFSQFFGGET
ncbi:MAG: DnaJ domain-containing protein [candidate division WOR-3 bacterium]|nr:MAG: DnaJ domain-containing protein [candidate division WOR-3 bacterium]